MLLQEHRDDTKVEGCGGCESVPGDGFQPEREGGR